MSAGIGELFIELAFKGDAKGAKEFKKKVDEVAKSMNATMKVSEKASKKANDNIHSLIKGFGEAVIAIKAVVATYNTLISTLNSNQAWINLTRQTDLALDSLQQYGKVANILDKSLGAEGAAQSIANLEQRLYELQLTGEGAEGFMYAGINPMGKNAFQIIEELRNRIKGLNNVQANFLLKKMGIDPRMIALLRMTREEFESLNREMSRYTLTDRQRKAIQQYQQEITIATQKMQYFKERAIMAIMPALVKFAQHTAIVVEGLAKAVKGIRQFYNGLTDVQKGVIKLGLLITGLIALVTAIAAHPLVGGLLALLTAIYLIVDDIMVGLMGGDSYFRDFLNWADEFVNDEKVPQWIRDLVYIITNYNKIKRPDDTKPKDVVVKPSSNLEKKFNEIDKDAKQSAEIDKMITISSFTGAGAGIGSALGGVGAIPGAIIGLIAGLLTTTVADKQTIINQNNYINTTETGEATLQGLEQTKAVLDK